MHRSVIARRLDDCVPYRFKVCVLDASKGHIKNIRVRSKEMFIDGEGACLRRWGHLQVLKSIPRRSRAQDPFMLKEGRKRWERGD